MCVEIHDSVVRLCRHVDGEANSVADVVFGEEQGEAHRYDVSRPRALGLRDRVEQHNAGLGLYKRVERLRGLCKGLDAGQVLRKRSVALVVVGVEAGSALSGSINDVQISALQSDRTVRISDLGADDEPAVDPGRSRRALQEFQLQP